MCYHSSPVVLTSVGRIVRRSGLGPVKVDILKPAFLSQDPWVTQSSGYYYYSERDGSAISIRKSGTLTGLSHAAPQTVWRTSAHGGYGLANIWAPEIHILDGRWYIYFSADQRRDKRHRLYVLEEEPIRWILIIPAQQGH